MVKKLFEDIGRYFMLMGKVFTHPNRFRACKHAEHRWLYSFYLRFYSLYLGRAHASLPSKEKEDRKAHRAGGECLRI